MFNQVYMLLLRLVAIANISGQVPGKLKVICGFLNYMGVSTPNTPTPPHCPRVNCIAKSISHISGYL